MRYVMRWRRRERAGWAEEHMQRPWGGNRSSQKAGVAGRSELGAVGGRLGWEQ